MSLLISAGFLLLTVVSADPLDSALSVIGSVTASSLHVSASMEKKERGIRLIEKKIHSVSSSTMDSPLLASRKEQLLEILEMAKAQIQADMQKPPRKVAVSADSILGRVKASIPLMYSPQLADSWLEMIRKSGANSDDMQSLTRFLRNPSSRFSWSRLVFLIDPEDSKSVQLRIAAAHAIINGDSTDLEKRAAFASLAVWRPQLSHAADKQFFMTTVMRLRSFFLQERVAFGIEAHEDQATVDFANFKKTDKKGAEAFKRYYAYPSDPEISQLVAGLSGLVRFTGASGASETDMLAFKIFRETEAQEEFDFVKQIEDREEPALGLADCEAVFADVILNFKGIAFAPKLTNLWLTILGHVRHNVKHRTNADNIAAELLDKKKRLSQRAKFQSLETVDAKIKMVDDVIPLTFHGVSRNFQHLIMALIGNLAMWHAKLVAVSPRTEAVEASLRSLRQILLTNSWIIFLQRVILEIPTLKLVEGEPLLSQLQRAVQEQRCADRFENDYYDGNEAAAVGKLSLFVSLVVAVRGVGGGQEPGVRAFIGSIID